MSIVSPNYHVCDLTLEELRAEFVAIGVPAFRASQVFAGLYKRGFARFEDFTDLPKPLREKLAALFRIEALEPAGRVESRDGTIKLLFRFRDCAAIETVLIPAVRRRTVCISTQAGCKFGCAFCASGLNGFKRNLVSSEIVGQALYVEKRLGIDVTNYVFMGMGEPLDNWDNVEKALRIMNAPEGMGVAARRMTISTAGYVPAFPQLEALDLQINLSISLHAVTDRLRDRLMPINRKYPLEKLVETAEHYIRSGGRMITLEYIVMCGLNDSLDDADGLAAIARRLRAKVNLIAYSPVPGVAFEAPSSADVARFKRWLEERRVRVTVRQSKGADIAAACGQLAAR